jgi:CBS domain-containing protein
MKVADAMARHVEFIDGDANVQSAAVMMGELDVGALPVGSPESIEGIVTDRDLIYRVVAEGLSNIRTRVREVMSTTIFSCHENDPIETAMDVMGAHNVRRLPVLDADGRVVGWITLADISRRLLLDSGKIRAGLEELSAAPS